MTSHSLTLSVVEIWIDAVGACVAWRSLRGVRCVKQGLLRSANLGKFVLGVQRIATSLVQLMIVSCVVKTAISLWVRTVYVLVHKSFNSGLS